MTSSLANILLILGAVFISYSILFPKSKYYKDIKFPKYLINLTFFLGIVVYLSSFILVFPFTKSRYYHANTMQTGNYFGNLNDQAKLQAVTNKLIINKFSSNDTIFFKGGSIKGNSFFAVITIFNIVLGDSNISFSFYSDLSQKLNNIKFDKNFGSINLASNTISFGNMAKGKIDVDNSGLLRIIPLTEGEDWEYLEN